MSAPEKSWRCFHCDEVFTDRVAAAEHFGCEIQDAPFCKQLADDDKALLKVIADQATQIFQWHNESTPADKLYYEFRSQVSQQAIKSEELGYRRGLNDGRRDWFKILCWRLDAKFSALKERFTP
jgi:hypothetical protein